MAKDQRMEFQQKLLDVTGLKPENIWFQPPPDVVMKYPCIVYERDDARKFFANDGTYFWRQSYTVTYIDRNPDSAVIDKLMAMPLCEYDRHFATSGLNHDVFTIYH